ncbi:uncharacterized protein [Typha latifolia]|uniref:uncharacterized protein n=1 Tax=Typha latifolia TaxID=4733 RepID=UPI003C2EC45F
MDFAYSPATNSERSNESMERIAWLRSQLIGSSLEFDTPFGNRLLTYADHTASGRCLHYIEDYIIQEALPIYGNTHTEDSFVGSKTTRMAHKASDYIKQCLGGKLDDVLIFCGSGSSAAIKRLQEVMAIAVPSIMREKVLQSLEDEERWVVFVGPYEHHSNLLSWRQSTADVVEIGIDENGLLDMEELKTKITSPEYTNRPLLGSFSACSNVTGMFTDTRALARLLHQHGAFACFDFAASGPYVEIDMRSGDIEGYDAIFLSPHKFVGGPGTPGILLMNKALYQLRSSPPSTCGGGTVAYVNGFNEKDTLYYEDIEEREDSGTPPIIPKIRAALAFWVKEYVGHELISQREHVYAKAALRRLTSNPRIAVLGNTQLNRLPIFSFLLFPGSNAREEMKPLHGRFVAMLLNDLFGIQSRGGCACAGPYGHHLLGVDKVLSLRIRSVIEEGYNGLKPGWTRISFSYYSSDEEFEFILAAIELIATYGHRFLALYQFDWATGDWTFRKRAFKQHHMMNGNITLASSDLFSEKSKPTNANAGRKGEKNSMEIDKAKRFESYLENAKMVALSLPNNYHSSIPEGVDPSIIVFRI